MAVIDIHFAVIKRQLAYIQRLSTHLLPSEFGSLSLEYWGLPLANIALHTSIYNIIFTAVNPCSSGEKKLQQLTMKQATMHSKTHSKTLALVHRSVIVQINLVKPTSEVSLKCRTSQKHWLNCTNWLMQQNATICEQQNAHIWLFPGKLGYK